MLYRVIIQIKCKVTKNALNYKICAIKRLFFTKKNEKTDKMLHI